MMYLLLMKVEENVVGKFCGVFNKKGDAEIAAQDLNRHAVGSPFYVEDVRVDDPKEGLRLAKEAMSRQFLIKR